MMINNKENPVQWALLLDELDDAREHLTKLIDEMNKKGETSEVEFGIYLGHIYLHINRGWNSRNRTTDLTDEEFEVESEFPKDIRPV